MSDVDALRDQLRDRGYLTHGIERWFALDPWSSRTFWQELAIVALKAATLIAVFAALPLTAIMLFRNAPVGTVETLELFLSYAAAWVVIAFLFVVAIALILKVRPALAIDTPRALLAISLVASAVLLAPAAFWWSRFDTLPTTTELAAGSALMAVVFLVSTIVISAALLSFSIYELRRVPAIHQKSRALPMIVAAIVLIAFLFVPAWAERERLAPEPMVVTTPTTARIALIAVDGLTDELLASRPDLARNFANVRAVPSLPGDSTTERWASLGTGVRTDRHGVRALEGIRFRGTNHILQRVSRADVVLMDALPFLKIVRREPLPPTVRRRDYVWEITAARGLPSVAVNWWTTADTQAGALQAIGPESIFASAQSDALRVDGLATSRFLGLVDARRPRLATLYLPALDVVLNRVELDAATRLAQSLRALDGLTNTVALVRARGYDVVLTGMPGEGQRGSAVIASTLALQPPSSAFDVTPTVLDVLGFPLSTEMPGHSLASPQAEPRIATYGSRTASRSAQAVNEEYYQQLKSLGYIR